MLTMQDKQRRDIRNKADVGPKEREFMFNWNVFLKEHPVYADLQVNSLPHYLKSSSLPVSY